MTMRVGSGNCSPGPSRPKKMTLELRDDEDHDRSDDDDRDEDDRRRIDQGRDHVAPSLTIFSMKVESRWRIRSRMPPVSPASIMLTKS